MPRLRFTVAAAEDAALVARMIRRAFRPQIPALTITRAAHPYHAAFETAAGTRARMAHAQTVLVAWLGETPVGTVSYSLAGDDPTLGEIRRLAVLPECRGQRYGERLTLEAERRLRRRGATRVELSLAGVFPGLQVFYERLGYLPVGQASFRGLPFPVLFMRKALDPGVTITPWVWDRPRV